MSPDVVYVDVVAAPIDPAVIRAFLHGDAALGGICTFEGVTRSDVDDRRGPIAGLEYEAYDEMARRQMRQLATNALERWGPGRTALIHRIGPVRPCEVSVAVGVACGHRREAFAACRWLIDALKEEVAIWKKDVFRDGSKRWVAPVPEVPDETP